MTARSIRYVAWRDGKPRFTPGAAMRAKGFRGKDLKHPDGRWFTFGEAVDWSAKFRSERETGSIPKESIIPLSRDGYVYFLWAGDAIKIGFASNPFTRAQTLMVGVGAPLRLYLAVPGSREEEQRLHKRLRAQHVRGEWFKASLHTLRVLRHVLNESDSITPKTGELREF